MKKILSKIILTIVILSPFMVGTSALAIPSGETDYVLLEPSVINQEPKSTSPGLVEYLKILFTSLLSLAVILSVLEITWGGIEWILSATPFGKSDGKTRMKNALFGLLLALGSWLILSTINPALINFEFIVK